MSDSTEEEIIKRRRPTRQTNKILKNLFDEESSASSIEYIPEDTQQSNLFSELFGTGKEYFYIFDEHKQSKKEETVQSIDKNDLITYMKNIYDYEDIEKICDLYIKGYNIYYIFFYKTNNMTYYDFLDVYKNIINFTSKSSDKFNLEIFNIFFDRLYNGSLNLSNGDKIVSLTKDKSVIKGVVLDHFGNLLEKFSSFDNKIDSEIQQINPKYILVSGYNNTVRGVIQLLIRFKVFYMESKYYPKMPIYEKLVQIGKLGIFPEIVFLKMYKNCHISNSKNIIYKEEYNNEEILNIIKIAITSVIAIVKINLDFLLQSPEKLEILDFLGLKNCTRIFENNLYENEDDIRHILKDDVLYKNFMTFFTISKTKMGRPVFKGFPDSFIFRELININVNSIEELINKEVEGKIFFVDEYYVLVNILNNITCYVRNTDKYFINQIVKVKITEINEPFLSLSGEIVNTNRIPYRIIKHPLLCNLNSKDTENKLKEGNNIFLLRQSNKDGNLIIVLKIYENIIVHIKLEEYENIKLDKYENIDEVVNKKVKDILRNVKNIKKYKYFYKNEDEAMSKISIPSEYIKYGFFFSEEYPGKLCFIFTNQGIVKEYLGIDNNLKYKGKEFNTLEEFIDFKKKS